MILAKAMAVADMHKRYKDSSSIKGQIEVQNLIQQEIIDAVKEEGITHIFVTGDWYDRGFHGLGPAYGSIEMDRRISAAVNGNVYLCVGNHFYLERDENPEMYIIQPNDFIKTSIKIPLPEKPIFKVVKSLRIGDVQISFFHFNKMNKMYIQEREEGVKFHIGIYHDDKCVPSWVSEMDGYSGGVSVTTLNALYNNVDLAIHGHIHSKVGVVSYELMSGRKIPLWIPGSMSITQNKESMKHTSVTLPIITIHDTGEVEVSGREFSTHMDLLKFYNTKKHTETKPLDTILNNASETFTRNNYVSLNEYLRSKGYKDYHLQMINSARSNSLDLSTAVAILYNARNASLGV